VGIHHIGAARLSAWRVPVPPLSEQRRIAAAIEEHFSRLDAADELLRRAMVRLKTLRRAVFSRTVSVGDSRTVGDLLERIEAGKSFRCHGRRADDDEWGVIKVSAMTWGSFDERENKAVLSTAAVDPRWEIKPGDLLLSRANTTEYVGASVLVRRSRPRLLLSDKSMRLITKADAVSKDWLQLALSAPESRAQMSAVATGTSDSMRNISQEKVMSIRVKIPPLSEQDRIVAEVERELSLVGAMHHAIEAASRRSVALHHSILEQAFRGKLVPQEPSDERASVLPNRVATSQSGDMTERRPELPA
jgi:type I restriction enzyme S subunit